MSSPSPASDLQRQDAVLVLLAVAGSSAACTARGDLPTAHVLQAYYALAADATRAAGGRVIKVIGDGVLLTFPIGRAREAVSALQGMQRESAKLWTAFDPGCRVQLKMGAGPVVAGTMGPPDDQRFDVYGDTLNRLFKMPPEEFLISPEVRALLS